MCIPSVPDQDLHVTLSEARYLVLLLHSDDLGPWDPAAVEPSTCSSERQDLAEPDTFDAEGCICLDLALSCGEGAEILFHLCKSGRKSPKCFRDMGIHTGQPSRKSWNLRDLRFEVCKFRKESIELFIRCTSGAGAPTIDVGARAIRRTKKSQR